MATTYLTTDEAAEFLRVSRDTLRAWRYEKRGPIWFRPSGSRRVLYALEDVEAWIEASRAEQSA